MRYYFLKKLEICLRSNMGYLTKEELCDNIFGVERGEIYG